MEVTVTTENFSSGFLGNMVRPLPYDCSRYC